ncbi:MAG: Hpt domain-containing protein [Thiomonas sp.]
MGPLAWLLDQISDNLQSARTALKRAAQQPGDDLHGAASAEKSGLRTARTQVHQAAGAIELLGFFGAARLMQAAESALDHLIDHPEKLDSAALQRFEAGFNALVDYLEAQRAGKNEPALKLFPQYRDLMELAQAERIHPADLWDHDWTWPEAPALPDTPPLGADDRGQFEMGLLRVLRGQQIDAAMRDLDAVARKAQAAARGPTASLWWLARGVFEALGAGLLAPDLDIKRLLNRLNLQLRSQLQGQNPAPQRLGHDLTFFCAQALHASGQTDPSRLPNLRAIDTKLQLSAAPFADYRQSHFGRIDPALVQQVRKRVQALRDAWSALAGQTQTHLDPARMARLTELAQALQQPLHTLVPGSEALAAALVTVFKAVAARNDLLTPERALDVATAILFLEISFGHFRPEEQHFLERAQTLAQRLNQSAQGLDPAPLAGWMEDLFRQASESQTMGSVVQELRADMSTVEKLLDAYFRNPATKPDLAPVPQLLSQMRGVFSVLGVDVASAALTHLRDEIDELLGTDTPPDSARFDALASNIGVLGFLVDMLSYQPELAKSLFVFDPEQKLLRAIVPSTQRTAPPTPQQDVEQAAEQLRQDVARGLAPEQAEQRLAQLRADAALAGVPDIPAQLLQPEQTPEPPPGQVPVAPQSAAVPAGPASVTAEAPPAAPVEPQAPAAQAEPAAAEEASSAEDELTDIFLEEAREVIANAQTLLQHLRAQPDDQAALTSLRRAFHTLKGSSRMVGLGEYGEAAWALEQVFNRQIAELHRATPGLLDLAQLALAELGQWTEAIAHHAADRFTSDTLRQAAEAYTSGKPVAPQTPAAEPAVDSRAVPVVEPAAQPTAEPVANLAAEPAAAHPAELDGLRPTPPGDDHTAPQHTPSDVQSLLAGIDLELPPLDALPPADIPVAEEADMAAFEAALAAQQPPHPAPAAEAPAIPAPEASEPESAPAQQAAPTPQPEDRAAQDAAVRQIGDLRIPTPLYNIYLTEADELARTLQDEIHAWLRDPAQPLGEYAVVAAHKLAGSSATVGLRSVADLASQTEHALDALHALPPEAARPADLDALAQAASDIKQLLHQFAAGLLKPVQPELPARLDALREAALAAAATPGEPRQTGAEAQPAPPLDLPPVESATPEEHAAPEPAMPEPAMPESTAPGHAASGVAAELPPAPAPTVVQAEPLPAAASPQEAGALRATVPEQLVDTIDPDLFPIFEEEAGELLPALAASLRQWEQHPIDPAPATQAMRALHTFKGSARMAGAMRLGELAHQLESDIDALAANTPVSDADLAELLGRFDQLSARFDRLCQAAQQGQTQLAELPTSTTVEALPAQVGSPPAQPAPQTEPASTPAAQTAAEAAAQLATPRIVAQAVRVRAGLLDRLVNQAGEITISRARLENEFAAIRSSVADLGENLERLRQQVREIEIQAEAQMTAQVQAARDEHREFDPLEFDRFTRAQELTRMMAESVNDIAMVQTTLGRLLREVDDDLTRQARQTRELQRDLLRTRMVEFDSLSERLYRTVRQAAKDLGKAVRLEIIGGNIELDRGVLERVSGSFDHLLRNAVAHGIETAEERQAAGKPAVGTITLSLRQDGNEVVITVADDGRGLNYAAIRAKAERLGLIAPGQTVSDEELAQLVFRPHFSSAENTTNVAGRGVGLDVVRTEVAALGGRVLLDNQPGAGARFTLLLPLTTAITHVVLLRTGDKVYAVPANLVEIVRRFKPEQIASASQTLQIDDANGPLPFYWLGALLGQSGRSSEPFGKSVPVIVIRSATQRVAIQVDEVLGNREVVVKNLGPQLSRVPGLAGISVLPSGEPALIYNPVALASVYGPEAAALMQSALQAPAVELTAAKTMVQPVDAGQSAVPAPPAPDASPRTAPLIMVVDDSITVRRVTQRFLQRNGYLVQLAKDGLDALEQLQQASTLPDVILLDIEMPRMDGFDLTRNIRADARLHNLPIIMITSRIADKHRNYAAQLGVNHYLGKPYSENELLKLIQDFSAKAAQPA